MVRRSKDDEVWQAVTAEVLAQVDEICRRRGMACEVVQKTAAGAVHSDSDLLNKLRSAIAASQQACSLPVLTARCQHLLPEPLVQN